MSLLWVKLVCKKDIGVIKEGTIGYVFRDNPNEDVVCAYIDYLRQALKTKSGGGDVDWSTHNAKRLVWDLGNQRTLSSVRNIVSWFSKSEGIPLQTLRTGNSGRSGAEANAQAIKDIKATVGDLSDVTKS